MTNYGGYGMYKGKMQEERVQLPIHKELQSRRRKKQEGMFIKGPIPLDWITRAARLPGRTMNTAMALWFLAGLCSSDTIRLSKKTYGQFSVTRSSVSRHLNCLEKEGLIRVNKRLGRLSKVTILKNSTKSKNHF